jgi:hypothetical protein
LRYATLPPAKVTFRNQYDPSMRESERMIRTHFVWNYSRSLAF